MMAIIGMRNISITRLIPMKRELKLNPLIIAAL